jgi:hypothetical protein
MYVGHTHNDCDQHFGSFSSSLKAHSAYTLDELADVLTMSYGPILQHVALRDRPGLRLLQAERPRVEELVSVEDWKNFLNQSQWSSPESHAGIYYMQAFRYRRDQRGQIILDIKYRNEHEWLCAHTPYQHISQYTWAPLRMLAPSAMPELLGQNASRDIEGDTRVMVASMSTFYKGLFGRLMFLNRTGHLNQVQCIFFSHY